MPKKYPDITIGLYSAMNERAGHPGFVKLSDTKDSHKTAAGFAADHPDIIVFYHEEQPDADDQ